MDFATFLRTAPYVAKSRFPILIRGRHGIGKSEVVYQMPDILAYNPKTDKIVLRNAKDKVPEGQIPYKVIERRASQMTEGELTGLPSTQDGVTTWNPPDWFKDCCDNPRILLMDEIDRGVLEVRQSFFELTDSRKIYGNALHPGTLIFAAVNGGDHGSQYTVSEMDPAEHSRWTTYDLEPSVEDWLIWSRDRVDNLVWDFINSNQIHLEHKGEFEPNKVYPCRRSWVRFDKCARDAEVFTDPKGNVGIIYQLALGFLGIEAAVAFRDFAEKFDKQVTVEDLLIHGKFDLIKDWKQPENAAMILKMREGGTFGRIMTPVEIKNLQTYFKMLPGELAMTLFSDIMATSGEGIDPKDHMKQVAAFHGPIKEDVLKLINGGVVPAKIGEDAEEKKEEE